MREIKFRAWSKYHTNYSYSEASGLAAFFAAVAEHDRVRPTPVVLQQFTGLHDKNGKEIYEGDILDLAMFDSGGRHAVEVVQWDEGESTFHLSARLQRRYEVIGDIRRTPELLAVNK